LRHGKERISICDDESLVAVSRSFSRDKSPCSPNFSTNSRDKMSSGYSAEIARRLFNRSSRAAPVDSGWSFLLWAAAEKPDPRKRMEYTSKSRSRELIRSCSIRSILTTQKGYSG